MGNETIGIIIKKNKKGEYIYIMSKFMSFVSPKKVNILYNLDNVKKVYTEDDIAGPSLCIVTELGTEHYFYKIEESRDAMYASRISQESLSGL